MDNNCHTHCENVNNLILWGTVGLISKLLFLGERGQLQNCLLILAINPKNGENDVNNNKQQQQQTTLHNKTKQNWYIRTEFAFGKKKITIYHKTFCTKNKTKTKTKTKTKITKKKIRKGYLLLPP